jgi:hypothetical protein
MPPHALKVVTSDSLGVSLAWVLGIVLWQGEKISQRILLARRKSSWGILERTIFSTIFLPVSIISKCSGFSAELNVEL